VVGKCQDEAEIVERGMKLIAEFEPFGSISTGTPASRASLIIVWTLVSAPLA
jgi:hypothetical protein